MADFNTAAWLVDRHVDEGWGGRVAIRCEGRSTSYADLAAEIGRAQAMLSSLGLGVGDRVAMVVQDDEAFPAFFLGAQRGGMVAVPLSTMLHGQELAAIVADCGATVLIVSDTFVSALDAIADGAPELRDIVVAGPGAIASLPASIDVHRWTEYSSSELPAVARTSRDSAAFWLYSSGTTGIPKGVMHVHGNVPATIDTYATTILGIGPDGAEAVLCLRTRELVDVSARGRRHGDPESCAVNSARDDRSHRGRVADALLLESWVLCCPPRL